MLQCALDSSAMNPSCGRAANQLRAVIVAGVDRQLLITNPTHWFLLLYVCQLLLKMADKTDPLCFGKAPVAVTYHTGVF